MLWQPMHPKSNIRLFRFFSSFRIALCFFLKSSLSCYKQELQNNFCSFFRVSCKPTIFGKLIFTRCRGVLSQPVHPESDIRHSRSFSLFCSPPWFFPKTGLQVRMSNFNINFALSSGSLPISRQNLVNLYFPDFGACSANQCTQNQI